jgi:hypothetical protein
MQALTKTYTTQHADTFNTKYVSQKYYRHVYSCARFTVLTVVVMIQVFWAMMPFWLITIFTCILVASCSIFWGYIVQEVLCIASSSRQQLSYSSRHSIINQKTWISVFKAFYINVISLSNCNHKIIKQVYIL